MNKTLQNINDNLAWQKTILLALGCLLLLTMPEFAFAQAKTFGGGIGELGVPGVDDTKTITQNLGLILAFVGFIIILAAFAMGLPGVIMTFFNNLNDARKNEDWTSLFKYLGMVFAVVVLAFAIIALYNKYVVDAANAL